MGEDEMGEDGIERGGGGIMEMGEGAFCACCL